MSTVRLKKIWWQCHQDDTINVDTTVEVVTLNPLFLQERNIFLWILLYAYDKSDILKSLIEECSLYGDIQFKRSSAVRCYNNSMQSSLIKPPLVLAFHVRICSFSNNFCGCQLFCSSLWKEVRGTAILLRSTHSFLYFSNTNLSLFVWSIENNNCKIYCCWSLVCLAVDKFLFKSCIICLAWMVDFSMYSFPFFFLLWLVFFKYTHTHTYVRVLLVLHVIEETSCSWTLERFKENVFIIFFVTSLDTFVRWEQNKCKRMLFFIFL